MRDIEIVTQTKSDLTTLSDVKDYLGITTSDEDDQLEVLITAVSDFIKNETGREIVETEYKEKIDGNRNEAIVLTQYPVISVEKLTVDDEEITDYYLYKENAVIKREAIFDDWDEHRSYYFPEGKQNIVVEYTAGYEDVPLDIQKAVWDIIQSTRKSKKYAGLSKYAIGDESMTFSRGLVPSEAIDTIMEYKSVI